MHAMFCGNVLDVPHGPPVIGIYVTADSLRAALGERQPVQKVLYRCSLLSQRKNTAFHLM
jgi:hypothetical protein